MWWKGRDLGQEKRESQVKVMTVDKHKHKWSHQLEQLIQWMVSQTLLVHIKHLLLNQNNLMSLLRIKRK